ncbi:PH domain-containing protein [Brachybacterium sp. NBEC-018]|uniref:PH domain-containing protein n=1 Tax=Brachybacterium sp. NBEC-018 TaxID=2996004 RepID=UPI002174DDCE|nr:PH domain-containing protein [Brachybacterium sp. NBEC-018]UVY82923.1 PH domain-containing protein [Brachybacterium sp. NBEC-018]
MTDEELPTIVLRPRLVRVAGYATGLLTLAGVVFWALVIPGFTPGGRAVLMGAGVVALAICHLEARVRLIAHPDTLVVVNHLRTRTVDWAEVVGVSFPMGDPWAHLDLADGTTLDTMALQRADGRRAVAAAHRLAALVRERGEARPGTLG